MLELLTVASLVAILATLSVGGFRGYQRTSSHRAAARETVAVLRGAQVRAVSEAATHECRFTPTKLEVLSASGAVIKSLTLASNLTFVATGSSHGAAHGFTHSSTTGNANCYFYARGTATAGTVGIKRTDNAAEYDVSVEALTARVSYCEAQAASNLC